MTNDVFFVGYRKQMSAPLAAFLRARVALFLVGAIVLAAALAAWQQPFGKGQFEFGVVKSFTGIISEQPYPTLMLESPLAAPAHAAHSRVYLVAPGKHGAQDLVKGLDGRRVDLEGSLIYRDHQAMIEIRPASLRVADAVNVADAATPVSLGAFTMRGEIVDSKCYLGVMKPGNLKPHKACAIRCISGGCTPVLVVRDAAGTAAYLMLAGENGRPLNREVLGMVAEPLEISGTVWRQDNLLVLRAEPETYRRLE